MSDFERYRSFISVYKHGSLSAATKARILTHPAMSQHFAALEAELEEPLFVRAPRKMIPTEKGKELYTKIVLLNEKLESTKVSQYPKLSKKAFNSLIEAVYTTEGSTSSVQQSNRSRLYDRRVNIKRSTV
ncbi:LysR family transcriptional regulator [Sutcliffiella horikoshii]|uniref:LysR family transcriptional regulator n=1 Tax=Sutcliffiella horikoshii TaxID=79883 RepID=A0A5D4SVQ6_9BACI|nr:LysR family transcriptional regulator [Sutcliffiella horikoshii]